MQVAETDPLLPFSYLRRFQDRLHLSTRASRLDHYSHAKPSIKHYIDQIKADHVPRQARRDLQVVHVEAATSSR
jgi:hypothetical protein